MNTQPVSDQPVQTNQQNPVPVQQPKISVNSILLGVFIVILFILVGFGAYLYGAGKLGTVAFVPPQASPSPTPTIFTENTISPTVALSTPTASMSLKPTIKPTIATNPDGNTFSSDKLGISFYYSNTMGYDKNTTIKVLEDPNKVYVYEKSMVPTTGQSVERFPKDPKDTLSQAITKKFLYSISTSDCFVKIDPKKPSPTMTKATIGYPIPANADQPNFTYGEKCPDNYSESNGMAYFLEDSNYPDRFYYISIGQYGIPAYNTKPDSMWQETIVIY